MECGEIWVRQGNDDSDEENDDDPQDMLYGTGKWRQIRRKRYMLRGYYRQCSLISWLKSKFHTTDRAKQADYFSSLLFGYSGR